MRNHIFPSGISPILPLALGTASYGSSIPEKDAFTMLDLFYAKGGRIIDTAHAYAYWVPNGAGASEKTIGVWVEKNKLRKEIHIVTKGGNIILGLDRSRITVNDIRSDLNESLSRLRVDELDVFFLHRDDPLRPPEALIEILNTAVEGFSIKVLGCSNWRAERIRKANNYALKHKLRPFGISQIGYSCAAINSEAVSDKTSVYMDSSEYDFYSESNFPLIAYNAQASGFFSLYEKHLAGTADTEKIKSLFPLYDNEKNRMCFTDLKKTADTRNISLTAASVEMLVEKSPFPVFPVIGPRNMAQLKDSLDSLF